ncbi:hypothetical protein SAMN05518849_102240 [Sphingobium sp. AP50]|nr:hypothetical protein SAMN05518849_102240 [Sphingobium sp. AP50]
MHAQQKVSRAFARRLIALWMAIGITGAIFNGTGIPLP